MDITHDNVCSSLLSCFYSHLQSTGRPISSFLFTIIKLLFFFVFFLFFFCFCFLLNVQGIFTLRGSRAD